MLTDKTKSDNAEQGVTSTQIKTSVRTDGFFTTVIGMVKFHSQGQGHVHLISAASWFSPRTMVALYRH